MHWLTDPRGTLAGKMSPAVKTAMELLNNKDFKDQPIRNTNDPAYKQWGQFAGHVADSMTPISIKTARQGPKPGSNISTPERVLGQVTPQSERNAALYNTPKTEVEANKRAWDAKTKYDKKQKAGQNFAEGGVVTGGSGAVPEVWSRKTIPPSKHKRRIVP
jgi:hypothetical protein